MQRQAVFEIKTLLVSLMNVALKNQDALSKSGEWGHPILFFGWNDNFSLMHYC